MADLATFFRKKKERLQIEEQRRQDILKEWQHALESLFANIEEWLKPAINEGLEIQRGSYTIREEMLGSYEVPTLTLRFGWQKAEIVPAARFIVGGAGRVDVNFDGGTVMLVRLTPGGSWFIVREGKREELSPATFSALVQEIFA